VPADTSLWFDFFLTVPYERLTINHRTDVQTATLLVLVGVGVTELAVAARRRARVVAHDETLLAVLESTAGPMARGESADAVIDQVRVQIISILALRGCGVRRSTAGRGL
jgi:K+-sensing histidine kinase KdpD